MSKGKLFGWCGVLMMGALLFSTFPAVAGSGRGSTEKIPTFGAASRGQAERATRTGPGNVGQKICRPGKVRLCHIPPGNEDNPLSICISENAVPAHLAHGDYPGRCGENSDWSNALRALRQASEQPIDIRMEGTIPVFLTAAVPIPSELPDDPVVHSLDFLGRFKDLYRIEDPTTQLYLDRIKTEMISPEGDIPADAVQEGELRHLFFSQKHEGIPVFGASVAVHTAGAEKILMTHGRWLPELPSMPGPAIGPEQAEDVAVEMTIGSSLEVIGETSLMYFDPALIGMPPSDDNRTHLAWRVSLRGYRVEDTVGTTWLCFIDAHDGSLLLSHDELETAIDLDIQTANNTTSLTCWDAPGNYDDDDWFNEDGDIGYEPGADPYQDGLDANHWSRYVYDWYNGVEGYRIDSWDDAAEQVEIMVHVGDYETGSPIWRNAAWCVQCEHIKFGDGFVTLDIMAHEWSHAIDSYHGGLLYLFESGAIDEHFADVSGAMVDAEDWLIGEDRYDGAEGPSRNMADPPEFEQPDHYSNYEILPQDDDDGGVHTNSGIGNKAFYLATSGGQHHGHVVEGIGRAKTGPLWFWVLTRNLFAFAVYPQIRDLTVTNAYMFVHPELMWDWWPAGIPLYGYTEHDVCQITNAWAAVGVREDLGDADCDGVPDNQETDSDNDFTPDRTDNCPFIPNGQSNIDRDDFGDVCDDDIDGDGFLNEDDNCPNYPNPGQNPDFCTDSDADGDMNAWDNCRFDWNPHQEDDDSDGEGDACDLDDDNDGVEDDVDNCQFTPNPDQEDIDSDYVGTACDNCPETPNTAQTDCDNDGLGTACDGRGDYLHPGNSCSPPYFEEQSVFVFPGDIVQIGECDGCPAWLPEGFGMNVMVTMPFAEPATIFDQRGFVIDRGAASEAQSLLFNVDPSFHYQAPGTELSPFQSTRYFLETPASAAGGGYEITFRIEVGELAGMTLGQCPVE